MPCKHIAPSKNFVSQQQNLGIRWVGFQTLVVPMLILPEEISKTGAKIF